MGKNELNNFIQIKVAKALGNGDFVTKEYADYVIRKAVALSNIGVADEVSLRKFHHISRFVPIFVRRATGVHDTKLISIIAADVYENRATVNNDTDVKNAVIEALAKIDKLSYPQDVADNSPIPTYNTNKWVSALNDINMKSRLFGVSKDAAMPEITRGWSEMEINKFRDWIRFYEDGGHLAYRKTANTYTTESGVSIPFNTKAPIKMAPIPGLLEEEQTPEPSDDEARKIEEQDRVKSFDRLRDKIIGRINSAKRFLSSRMGRGLVGAEYNRLLKSLLDLEGDFLKINNEKTASDVIARAEQTLIASGYNDTAFMLVKIAQDPNPFGSADTSSPSKDDGGGDDDVKKQLIDTINESSAWEGKYLMPTNAQLRKEIEKEKKEKEGENPPAPAQVQTEPTEAVPPPPTTASYQWANYKTAELNNFENVVNVIAEVIQSVKSLKKIAQAVPALDKNNQQPGTGSMATKFFEEDALDKAFANIKLDDVIRRMQALSKVFKNREIARQLSIIDLMLDRLGIAGLFPQLAEATKSALESNQYSSIRIEEVLSKLMSIVDENGNVNIQVNQTVQKPSLIDQEMQKALSEPDVVTPNGPINPPIATPQPASLPTTPPIGV